MIDKIHEFEVDGVVYPMAFNMNVIVAIEDEFEDVKKWEDKFADKNFKVLRWTLCALINEGIDVENDRKSEKREFLTEKQVGRLLTSGDGIRRAGEQMMKVVSESSPPESSEEKN